MRMAASIHQCTKRYQVQQRNCHMISAKVNIHVASFHNRKFTLARRKTNPITKNKSDNIVFRKLRPQQ